jgi:hypothetical protein
LSIYSDGAIVASGSSSTIFRFGAAGVGASAGLSVAGAAGLATARRSADADPRRECERAAADP